MNRQNRTSKEMVSAKNITKVSCSTPEHQADSPSRDSDSIYDSDTASPVPFLCTQDGAEGETDVVWNFYTPKSEHAANSRLKSSTPVSRRSKRTVKPKIIVKQLPKRRPVRLPQKKTELFKELVELNELAKKTQNDCTDKANSEEDIFNDSPEYSPKRRLRSNSLCLRRNVLSSNFMKPESDAALESDDSMNECLIRASQIIEERIQNEPISKKSCPNPKSSKRSLKTDPYNKIDQDSMDILTSIKLKSPVIKNMKISDSPKLNNDSFDSLLGNLNDSALERLTQMPIRLENSKLKASKDSNNWSVKEFIVQGNSPSTKSNLGRHNSMPESPTITNVNLPSTSGMTFSRFSSMPFQKDVDAEIDLGDSPIRCTPDEIKKKHQLAREKLLAKRLLPFTTSQKIIQATHTTQTTFQLDVPKKTNVTSLPLSKQQDIILKKFQPRVPTTLLINQNKAVDIPHQNLISKSLDTYSSDIKSIIERKRQEALMKLRRRAAPSK